MFYYDQTNMFYSCSSVKLCLLSAIGICTNQQVNLIGETGFRQWDFVISCSCLWLRWLLTFQSGTRLHKPLSMTFYHYETVFSCRKLKKWRRLGSNEVGDHYLQYCFSRDVLCWIKPPENNAITTVLKLPASSVYPQPLSGRPSIL